jgi:hypothetical protein
MVQTYPTLATSFTVGKSYENREMRGLKISSNKTAVKVDGTPANKKKAVWWDGGKLLIVFIDNSFNNILLQVSMLVNGLVQQPIFILLMHFYQIIPKMQQLLISLISLIIIFYLYLMSTVMHIHGQKVKHIELRRISKKIKLLFRSIMA